MAQGRRVVITGLGTVCPNGNNVTSSWNSVINGESGAELIQRFDTSEFATKFGATVKDFDKNENIDPKDSRRLDPFIQFGLAATAEAIKDSGINFEEHDLDRIGVSIGSGIGGLETIEKNSLVLKEKGPKRISPLSPTTKLLSDLFMSGPKTLMFCFLHSSIKYETLSMLF